MYENEFGKNWIITLLISLLASLGTEPAIADTHPPRTQERVVEWTVDSRKAYADPFNDVDVDVVFNRGEKSWRVPMFWRGGSRWTVRFAPPSPGKYTYHLESTDKNNPDLNGHDGLVSVAAYSGKNALLKHGVLKVSSNKRYFEHADRTPFYWLGDTWWTGLSDRLSWDGFKKLTSDRKDKGFSVVQLVVGLVPSNEELAPVDPGFRNEGGHVWDAEFQRIDPEYFDYADRRIQHLVDVGIVPVIVGGWYQVLQQMGVHKMKQHWRYIIARYGAYPVLWSIGGEVSDSLASVAKKREEGADSAWAQVARYVRAIDPYEHPMTVHEFPAPWDGGLEDESLTDFDLTQASHFGWSSIATEIAQLTTLYARTKLTKPVIQGEIGYEQLGGEHLQDFQRASFWLAMLNGAAGYTYGTIETAEAYTADKPLHRKRWSFSTWEEAMNFPGARQVALNARLLRQYPWHRFAPHPEWVSPRGTTFLKPNDDARAVGLDLIDAHISAVKKSPRPLENEIPIGEWKRLGATFRYPYAAGIPGELRIIYIPYFGAIIPDPPTVLSLEPDVTYRAYYWDPAFGIKVDLGIVRRPQPGKVIFKDSPGSRKASAWVNQVITTAAGKQVVSLLKDVNAVNIVLSVDTTLDTDAALIFQYQDPDNYVAAVYSSAEKVICFRSRVGGVERPPLGETAAPVHGPQVRLTAEIRDGFGIVSITDGLNTFTSPIVLPKGRMDPKVAPAASGSANGVGVQQGAGARAAFGHFEVRESPSLVVDEHLERKLYDANGIYRGEMSGTPEWDAYGRRKLLLLDAYRPERFPVPQDWILVLEAKI